MPPQIAVVMLTPACGMTCAFCVTEPFAPMEFGEVVALLRGLRERGTLRLVLGGGEPFAWPHGTLALAARAKAMGFHVQVGTNGIDLPAAFERLGCVDRWVLPLESTDPAVHDGLRVFPRSHHAIVLDRLERLRATGKPVTVSTVVTRENLGGLPALGRFLEGYRLAGGGLHAWHLYRFLPVGRGGSLHAGRLEVGEAEYHRACDAVKGAVSGFHVYQRPDMLRSRTVGFHPAWKNAWAQGGIPPEPCASGLPGPGKGWNANCSEEPRPAP